jgi:predicted RNA-binding protein
MCALNVESVGTLFDEDELLLEDEGGEIILLGADGVRYCCGW